MRHPLGTSLADAEHEILIQTLHFAKGNKSRTAEILGISLKTLFNRIKDMDPSEVPPRIPN